MKSWLVFAQSEGRGYEMERISELHQYPPLQSLLRARTLANPCNRYVLYPLGSVVNVFSISVKFVNSFSKKNDYPEFFIPLTSLNESRNT